MRLITDSAALPVGWKLSTVGEECEIRDELRFPLSVEERKEMQGEFPYYGPTGVLDYLNEYRVDGTFALIGEDGDHFLKYAEWPMTQLVTGKFNVNNHAHLITGKDGCTTEWFFNYFHHLDLKPVISLQGVGRYKLTRAALEKLPVAVPPIPEQRAIAAVLSAWDRAIEQTTALIAAKERLKQGLMQQLLSGKRRFRGFGGEWRHRHLGDVAHESTLRNERGLPIEAVHSVTKANGMVPMPEDTVGADLSRYKRVQPKAFAYNPMRINIGSIARWDGDGEVLVSPDYVVFECGPDLDPDLLNHLRRSHRWDSYVKRSGDGSVRVRIYFDHLSRMPILLPGIDEQRRIAGVLNTANIELDLLQRRSSELKSQKRGLMQQLLTGKVRVPSSLLKKGAAS